MNRDYIVTLILLGELDEVNLSTGEAYYAQFDLLCGPLASTSINYQTVSTLRDQCTRQHTAQIFRRTQPHQHLYVTPKCQQITNQHICPSHNK
jgi:hypothetical protein